jgi:hypothetical protein
MVPTVLRGPGTGGRQRGRQVVDPAHGWALGLGQAPAAVGAQGLQEAVHALGVEGSDGQRGLPGSGYADDGDSPPQRNVHVHVPQVVVPGAAYLNGAGQAAGHGQGRRGPCGRGMPVSSPIQRSLIRTH